jgi:hypothetical protein
MDQFIEGGEADDNPGCIVCERGIAKRFSPTPAIAAYVPASRWNGRQFPVTR